MHARLNTIYYNDGPYHSVNIYHIFQESDAQTITQITASKLVILYIFYVSKKSSTDYYILLKKLLLTYSSKTH